MVYRRFSRPIARFLMRFDVHPNTITYFAFALGLISAYIVAIGRIYEGVLLLFISQIFDCVDGDLARMAGKTSRYGAFIDRVFDRFVDAAIIIAIVALNPAGYWLAGFLALTFSFGVSIARAMAEAEGAECKVGIAGRDTRIALIMIGLLLGYYVETLWIIAVLSFITTVHRIVHTVRQF
ncbi:Phosphatidylglycerophosphate synthase [Geoglobus ahangari]|uniref:Phosphatidylglycerophosphate synthase n=1 Tax=Geoglobus ahangari TaxID=113653 RepID=A0A0F7IFD7_9EURY|nr:CDP-alcohol phosphatidyltransferase family protein [Geoglobus ahangari]AKG91124.1 Phosphatidylglycerophosphate synthase [Geoglobus ahangari]